ncbi:hypothetical protein DS2_01360 [Catenovulum agarivorans DS-2]|uniref:DUF3549 domain-containing protein n=1 Tax=Catenovulum agarivorans DS-2 TaxID=1328313 RepID=W7QTG4_9ALTE|nr:DUF3549 family protein [Catenovulum agarivorans]EWH12327.1 hypothetical protein DS2_01360 [Catenovulum agarivorans DS-2]
MQNISTLYQLVQYAGCDYCVFDVGRRVIDIDKTTFEQFEDGQQAYPYPIQSQAKFALVYWPIGQTDNPYIWFLNLPLDEESQVIPGSRNHFVAIIQEALGNDFAQQTDEQQQLPDNPYIKLPEQTKVAIVNARIKDKFNRSYSELAQACLDYLDQSDKAQWRNLTVQGWADILVQKDPKVHKLLQNEFWQLPDELQNQLIPILEHCELPKVLVNKSIRYLENENSEEKQLAILRVLAGYCDQTSVQTWLTKQVSTDKPAEDILNLLLIVGARCWVSLKDPLLLSVYLEKIADLPANNFEALFRDAIALPSLRRPILALMQNPNALPKTRIAVSNMIKASYGTTH